MIAIIPPPRVNLITYGGVFAPNFKDREKIVPVSTRRKKNKMVATCETGTSQKNTVSAYYIPWHDLLRRVFKVDSLVCKKCHSKMKIVEAVSSRVKAAKVLSHLGLDSDPPQGKEYGKELIYELDPACETEQYSVQNNE